MWAHIFLSIQKKKRFVFVVVAKWRGENLGLRLGMTLNIAQMLVEIKNSFND